MRHEETKFRNSCQCFTMFWYMFLFFPWFVAGCSWSQPQNSVRTWQDRKVSHWISLWGDFWCSCVAVVISGLTSLWISLNLMVDFSGDFQSRRSWWWCFYMWFFTCLTSEEDPMSTPFNTCPTEMASTTISTTSLGAWTSNVRRTGSSLGKTDVELGAIS